MKRLCLIIVSMLVCFFAEAEGINETEALVIAQKFMPEKTFERHSTGIHKSRALARSTDGHIYVFNANDNGGFVIVDSRTASIVGYSCEGNLDDACLPINAKQWIGNYGQGERSLRTEHMDSKQSIAPLIKTKWGQHAPYNRQCPQVGEYNAATGCLATAMAQVLYYHQPNSATGVPGYDELDSLPPASFNWAAMQLEYDVTETGESADAVSKLMRYCGQAMKTSYQAGGSYAAIAMNEEVFSNVFGMSRSDVELNRLYYDTKTWEEMVYKELAALRPVLYAGFSSSDGHFFIIDGYEERDGQNFFHINFGWNGTADGYYSLSTANGFCLDQSALFGIKPDCGEDETLRLIVRSSFISFTDSVYQRSSPSEAFKNIEVCGVYGSIKFTNPTNVFVGWGLFDGLNLVDTLLTVTDHINSDYWHGYLQENKLSIGAEIKNGIYSIRQIWHAIDDTEWHLMGKANLNYIIATIEGDTLRLSSSTPNSFQFAVNAISYSTDNLRRNRKVEIKANITNLSNRGSGVPVYLFEEGVQRAVSLRCIYAEQGESEDIVFYYTPQSTGAKLLKFATDWRGEDVFFTDSVIITEGLREYMNYDVTIKDFDQNQVYSDTLKANIHITNPWDTEYDDDIKIFLYKEDESYSLTHYKDTIIPMRLKKGEATDIVLTYPLEKGRNYYLDIMQTIYTNVYYDIRSAAYCIFTCEGASSKIDDRILVGGSLFPADVYSINGMLVRKNVQSILDLSRGLYVVKGKTIKIRQ